MFDFFDSIVIIDTPEFRVVKRFDGSYAYGIKDEATWQLSDTVNNCFSNTPVKLFKLPSGEIYLAECPPEYAERFLTVMFAVVDDITHIAPIGGEGENNES